MIRRHRDDFCGCGDLANEATQDLAIPLCDSCHSLTPEFHADNYDRDFCKRNQLGVRFKGTYADAYLAGVAYSEKNCAARHVGGKH